VNLPANASVRSQRIRLSFVYNAAMGVGGCATVTDWPKMGPSLLIATSLIVAIRTARRSATHDAMTSNIDLDKEIEYAARVAQSVLSTLIAKYPSIFPQGKKTVVPANSGGSYGVKRSNRLVVREEIWN
jgi:hypothetical protein